MFTLLFAIACQNRDAEEDPNNQISQHTSEIPNENEPLIDLDTDGDKDFDNRSQYDNGQWITSVSCSNLEFSHLVRVTDPDQENGAPAPELLVSVDRRYVPDYLIDLLRTTEDTDGDFVYLDSETYFFEQGLGVYLLEFTYDDLIPFCDAGGRTLYIRLEAFDGENISDPLNIEVRTVETEE